MHIKFFAGLAASALLLGGCTTGLGGYGPGGGILGGILGGGGGGYGYDDRGDRFERAAVDACGREASRYGRIEITRVDQTSRDTVQVNGNIAVRDRSRDQFRCTFRSDGRIVDFRRG